MTNHSKYKTLLHAIGRRDKEHLQAHIKSVEDLTLCGKSGVSILAFLAKKGLLGAIEQSLLCKELLSIYDKRKMNAYLYASQGDTVQDIPPNLIDDMVLRMSHKRGPEVFMYLQKENQLKHLPKHCFTKKLLLEKRRGMNPRIVGLTFGGQLGVIPKEFFTPEIVLKGGKGTENHNSLLHVAAQGGCLDAFPEELLTQETLMVRDIYGHTILHAAARHGNLHQIPKEFLTKKNILEKCDDGATVIHNAIVGSCLEEIPMELIDKKILRIKDYSKQDVYAYIDERFDLLDVKTIETYYSKEFYQRLKDIWKTLDKEDLKHAMSYPNLKGFTQKEILRRKVKEKAKEDCSPLM
jgi:hypothetical protein